MASRNNFISGITELLILSLLSQNDKYVYEISKDIENLSDGLLKISQNTLYSATYKLEKDGYISEYSKKVGRKRVRVYYKIEDEGKEYLGEIRKDYESVFYGVENIFNKIENEQIRLLHTEFLRKLKKLFN